MTLSKQTIERLIAEQPLIEALKNHKHIFWMNEKKQNTVFIDNLSMNDVKDAEKRLKRFATYFMKKFPITRITNGILESDIKEINEMKKLIEGRRGIHIPGKRY